MGQEPSKINGSNHLRWGQEGKVHAHELSTGIRMGQTRKNYGHIIGFLSSSPVNWHSLKSFNQEKGFSVLGAESVAHAHGCGLQDEWRIEKGEDWHPHYQRVGTGKGVGLRGDPGRSSPNFTCDSGKVSVGTAQHRSSEACSGNCGSTGSFATKWNN
eukprot:1155795-Pelagomonas_calceolata.AAC.3